jgi:hypothetical protein
MVCGAAGTLVDSGLTPAEVMDLVPVKPLAEMEPQVLEFYRTRLVHAGCGRERLEPGDARPLISLGQPPRFVCPMKSFRKSR